MSTFQILGIAVIGLAAGILSGLLGLGGAIIIIPALVMFLGYSQQLAQGTTLIMMVLPVGALAAWQYYQQDNVNLKAAGILCIGMVIGGYLGGYIANHVSSDMLRKIFGVLLLLVSMKMIFTK